ncbi:MAG: hypothetical protein WAO02_18080 [Verrucomicrobiia bacterium]
MGFKWTNLKGCLALIGFVVLMGAILLEQKLLAAISKSHFTLPELMYAPADISHPATNGGFLDNINLSLDPPVEMPAPDLSAASRSLQKDLPAGSFDQLQPRPGHAPKPGVTVANRKLNYQLLDSGGFAFKLNLTPAYPYPEASIPTGLDPGFGISIKF